MGRNIRTSFDHHLHQLEDQPYLAGRSSFIRLMNYISMKFITQKHSLSSSIDIRRSVWIIRFRFSYLHGYLLSNLCFIILIGPYPLLRLWDLPFLFYRFLPIWSFQLLIYQAQLSALPLLKREELFIPIFITLLIIMLHFICMLPLLLFWLLLQHWPFQCEGDPLLPSLPLI